MPAIRNPYIFSYKDIKVMESVAGRDENIAKLYYPVIYGKT